jgi:tetratricopeptide (TPR) repeat protein
VDDTRKRSNNCDSDSGQGTGASVLTPTSFWGAEFEALGNGAEARQSYERAAALAPAAQSPLFGLSRVADQAGDRAAARAAIARVLKLPRDDFELADPWWVYEVAQSREIDRLLDDVRERF